MKYILVLFLLFSGVLNAEYLRTIRIASFNTQAESELSLQEIKEFISSHENILELQEKWDFEFKARASGRYYITLVEPFTQRKVLQQVIDTLRINYPDVYVTSLKTNPAPQKEIVSVVENTPLEVISEKEPIINTASKEEIIQETPPEIIPEPIPEVAELKIDQDQFVEAQTPKEEQDVVVAELVPEVQELQVPQEEVTVNSPVVNDVASTIVSTYLWQIISFILFIVLAYTLKKMFQYKRENETYFNSELIYNEKFKQLHLEIKDREKYLAHASHELRTPMTSIMGLTHLVLDANLPKQEEEYVKQIESSANNLLHIVNDILDVSKIKAGELRIEKTEFNINDTLEYVLNSISMQAKNNNINCMVDIGKDVPSRLIGDSLRLGQVLINLLGNAVKFTKDGEVALIVDKLSSHGDNISLEFIVRDTGIGISEEKLETIFDSFAQANDSTSRQYGGTGLGLSISQELVKMMHGEIKVKSEVGKGTTFIFSIVFKLKDHLNKRQYRLPSTKLLNKRILVVDQSSSNALPLIRMLGYFKYRTHAIPSFEESVLDENMDFDIVIINKNQLNFTTVEKLKVMQAKQNFKIVILNEVFTSLNTDILNGLNVDAYLQKPLNQQKVLNMIIEIYVSKKLDKTSRVKTSKNILSELVDKKVLIAEDNELNHKVISGLLAHTKIETVYVVNGKEAVDMLLSGQKFDLVLMDLGMPVMDGYEATQEIRKHRIFDQIPILALTADVMDQAIENAIKSGMQGHITKPIIIDIFYKKIYDALTQDKPIQKVASIVNSEAKEVDSEYSEISISVGLERYKNDQEFYASILKDFKKMYINSALDLEELCRIGDYKSARHKAMDIKDVALSIGAYKLCESAATMEYSLEKGPRSNWAKLIAFYEMELAKLFKDIDSYLKKNQS